MSAARLSVVRSQAGISLPEVLVAMVVVAIGMFAGLTALSSARKSTESGKGEAQAMALAQRELERIRSLPFNQVLMRDPLPVQAASGSPAGDENPKDPHFYVSGNRVKIMNNYADFNSGTMADSNDPGERMLRSSTGVIIHQSDISVAGRPYRIWRFVTRPPANCIAGLDQVDTSGLHLSTPLPALEELLDDVVKRVTVAVLPTEKAGENRALQAGPNRPLYLSTVLVAPGSDLETPIVGALTCP
jgi:prepilin-type N-terminal cleavage/methylation domain-containing protein